MTRTLCMWATIAGMVRPLPPGAAAFQAAAGRLSIRYWLMRLFVLNAFNNATGSWPANAFSEYTKAEGSGILGMMDLESRDRNLAGLLMWHKREAGARHISQHLVNSIRWTLVVALEQGLLSYNLGDGCRKKPGKRNRTTARTNSPPRIPLLRSGSA